MKRFLRRLARTSAGELVFRCRDAAYVAAEAVGVARGHDRWRRESLRSALVPLSSEIVDARGALSRHDWRVAGDALRSHFRRRQARFVLDPSQREELAREIRDRFSTSLEQARARAERLLAGRYDLLGHRDLSFGNGSAPDWQLDPVLGRRPPVRFWNRVPYLDPRSGDHKVIWELNRHQHWLALGRAAWLTADQRYVAAVAAELESWLAANPPLRGVNWSSMLELSIRSISWMWALHFSAAFHNTADSAWILDLLAGLNRQLDHVSRHLSVYFSPNTHLLGEGLALYVGGRTLPELKAAARWEEMGRAVLVREAQAQVHADGGHAELSTHYHRYALDFYLLALTVARRTEDPVAPRFEEVASRLATFCRALADDNGRLPVIGDDDGGMLFPICGRAPTDVRDSLTLAASLLRRPELALGDVPEEVLWMLGPEATCAVAGAARAPASQFFPDSGYVVLRSSGARAILDAGRHGFRNAGHAHADALSLVLTIDGRPLLIDPGTATYTTDPELRDRFRSTPMHNTIAVDGRSQSLPAGPFHWASQTHAHLDLVRCSSSLDYLEAWHDGYRPVIHRRSLLRIGDVSRTYPELWLVADHILGDGQHHADAFWHFDPEWTFEATAGLESRLAHHDGFGAAVASTADERRELSGDAGGLGWCSPVYGRVVPAPVLTFSRCGTAPFSMTAAIAAAPSAPRLSVLSYPVTAERDDGWHRAGAVVVLNGAAVVALLAVPRALGGAGKRSMHTVALPDGDLTTDARAAVLRLSESGEPFALHLVAGTVAEWAGNGAFSTPAAAEAGDLHFDLAALLRCRRGAGVRLVG